MNEAITFNFKKLRAILKEEIDFSKIDNNELF